jgi:hypothetical protein
LFANDRLERACGGTVSAARVEIDQVDCRQFRFEFSDNQSGDLEPAM